MKSAETHPLISSRCWGAAVSAIALLVVANSAIAAERLKALAEYERSSIRAAIERELERAQSALAQDQMDERQRILTRRFIQALNVELQLLMSSPSHEPPPIATIARGASTARYPSVGALLQARQTICSGTLIRRQVFLTAGHCFHESQDSKEFAVYLQHAGLVGVKDIHISPHSDQDVAILELKKPVDGITPVGNPVSLTSLSESRRIVGFGVTQTAASNSGIKRQGTIITAACAPPHTAFICWEFHHPYRGDSDSNVCARDSGSPVGRSIDQRLSIEDGISIRISPGLDCHVKSLSWSQAIYPMLEWLNPTADAIDSTTAIAQTLPPCCGDGVNVQAFEQNFPHSAGYQFVDHSFDIGPDTRVVRVALSAVDRGALDLDLLVRAPDQYPTLKRCGDFGSYAFCEFKFTDADPPPERWIARVEHRAGGDGLYQLVVTEYANPSSP